MPALGQFTPVKERLLRKVIVKEDGCWQWTGHVLNTGYGVINRPGRNNGTWLVHRVSYEEFVGPIPDGLTLDHLCRNRLCVNPGHLEPVSNRENILRGISPPAQNARKTHCKHGHEFTPENIYIHPKRGKRHCRTCKQGWRK